MFKLLARNAAVSSVLFLNPLLSADSAYLCISNVPIYIRQKKYTNWAVRPSVPVIRVDTVPNSTQSTSPTADQVGPFGNLKESNGITCARAAVDEGTCAGVY